MAPAGKAAGAGQDWGGGGALHTCKGELDFRSPYSSNSLTLAKARLRCSASKGGFSCRSAHESSRGCCVAKTVLSVGEDVCPIAVAS